jgi:hypothetical protein
MHVWIIPRTVWQRTFGLWAAKAATQRRLTVRWLFLDEAESLDGQPDLGALAPGRGLGVQRQLGLRASAPRSRNSLFFEQLLRKEGIVESDL